jgi:TolB-like protein/Tfp pilus assembly protein PilF
MLAIVAAGAFAWRAGRREAATTPSAAPSIAVLPFKDLSPEHDQEYLSDGMTEEILSALAKVKGLRVPGRVSSFYFKGKNVGPEEIAQKLGVTHLLEGSVRRSGNKLRILAEVVRVSDGERIWSQTFERDLADVFAIQDEISRDVVQALRVKLMPGQPLPAKEYRPTNQDAYQSYLLGKHFARSFTGNSQTRAAAAFEKAVELDPAYASAWAALAEARIGAGMVGAISWSDARQTALVAANRAVELGPDLPEALAARAQARLQEWDWPGAKADIDRALELGPENPQAISAMGSYLFQMGKDSAPIWRRVVESEPLDGRAWARLGATLTIAGQFAEADRDFARASEVDPDGNGANARTWLIVQARPAEALALCQGLGRKRRALDCEARAHHALGNASEAQRALDALTADTKDSKGDWLFSVAVLYAYLGQPDEAFDWLERARAEHVRALNGIKVSGDLRALHADPRWVAFLRKMNLPVD